MVCVILNKKGRLMFFRDGRLVPAEKELVDTTYLRRGKNLLLEHPLFGPIGWFSVSTDTIGIVGFEDVSGRSEFSFRERHTPSFEQAEEYIRDFLFDLCADALRKTDSGYHAVFYKAFIREVERAYGRYPFVRDLQDSKQTIDDHSFEELSKEIRNMMDMGVAFIRRS